MLIPGQVISSFLIWTGETRTLVLRTDEELWKERLYSCVMTWFVHFLTQCVKGKKTFSTYLLWPSKNISHWKRFIPILLRVMKRCRATEEGSFRESKIHSPVWLACGTKAGTILANSPGFFLCPLLTIVLLSIFEIVLVHCATFLKILKSLSFIGTKIVGKESSITQGLAETINKVLKG